MLTVIKADITTLQVDAIVNAKLTKGYLIPAKYVIHTVGLVWYGDKSGEADLLASCYRRSRPFPRISTGVYNYPVDQAAKIAVNTMMSFFAAYMDDCVFIKRCC